MDPKSVIESYVDDVVLHVPARLRKDVGIELRELLMEELSNKAGDGVADEAMAKALLKDFGAPGDVAARYRPAGITAIPAREARVFSWLSIGGVLAQWALSFPLQVALPTHDDFLTRLGVWAAGSGMHAFALPGALAFSAMIWAWWLHRTTGEDTVVLAIPGEIQPLPPLEPSNINRWTWGAALIGFAIGIPLYAMTPQIITQLPEPAPATFALDPGFVRDRGPWLLGVWFLQLALFLVVLVDGRWRPLTRRVEMALNLAGGAMLVWFTFGGPMFQNAETDGYAKLIMGGIALLIVFVTGVRFWREQARVGQAKPTVG